MSENQSLLVEILRSPREDTDSGPVKPGRKRVSYTIRNVCFCFF